MADKQSQIRTQLQNKIFTPYGKTVTLYVPSTSISYDTYGNRDEATIYTTSDLVIVDYDIIDQRKTHEAWGDLQVGDRLAIAPYDDTIDVDYYIGIGSDIFKIAEVEKPALPNTVVNIFRMTKTTDSLTTGTTTEDSFLFIDSDNFVFIDGDNFVFIE